MIFNKTQLKNKFILSLIMMGVILLNGMEVSASTESAQTGFMLNKGTKVITY